MKTLQTSNNDQDTDNSIKDCCKHCKPRRMIKILTILRDLHGTCSFIQQNNFGWLQNYVSPYSWGGLSLLIKFLDVNFKDPVQILHIKAKHLTEQTKCHRVSKLFPVFKRNTNDVFAFMQKSFSWLVYTLVILITITVIMTRRSFFFS